MKDGWYEGEKIKNENIPPEYIYIFGHRVRKNGKEITSYYQTAKDKYFKVGSKKGDKPIKITYDEFLEDMRVTVGTLEL